MARNGPPVSVFGFGSNDSNWLSPPLSRTINTCFFLASICGGDARLRPVARRGRCPPRRPACWTSSVRRETGGSANDRRRFSSSKSFEASVIQTKLGRSHQRPHELLDRQRTIGRRRLRCSSTTAISSASDGARGLQGRARRRARPVAIISRAARSGCRSAAQARRRSMSALARNNACGSEAWNSPSGRPGRTAEQLDELRHALRPLGLAGLFSRGFVGLAGSRLLRASFLTGFVFAERFVNLAFERRFVAGRPHEATQTVARDRAP